MKKYISLFIIISLILGLFGCSKDYGGKTVSFEASQIPTTIDPFLAAGETEMTIVENVYEPLLNVTEEGKIIPGAAESYSTSENGLKITFKLCRDARWSDGRAVLADDFVFSLCRGVDPETKWIGVDSIACIKNAQDIIAGRTDPSKLAVYASDDFTLVIDLSIPDDDFLLALAGVAGIPCRRDFFEESGGKYGMDKDSCLCNGPFYVSRWIKNEGEEALKISKNKEYHGDRSAVSSGIYFTFDSEKNRLSKIKTGSIDGGIISKESLSSGDENNIISCANAQVSLVFSSSQNALTADKNLRKALYLSADRSCLSTVLSEYEQPLDSILLPNSFLAGGKYIELDTQSVPTQNNEEAVAAFAQAQKNIDVKKLSELKLIYSEEDERHTIINYSVQCWQKLFGINVKVEKVRDSDISPMLKSGEAQMAVISVNPVDRLAVSTLNMFEKNKIPVGDDQYTELIKAGSTSNDKVLECEKYLFDNYLVFPLYFTQKYFVFSKSVVNPEINSFWGTLDFSKIGISS